MRYWSCFFGLGLYVAAGNAIAQETTDEHHKVEEVVVSAVPIERTVEELAQPTGIVDGDELIRRQAASIGEAISDQPGVSATYFGPVASRPVIRGQFGERVTVLSNGLDSLDASALSEDHAVSTDTILAERIEIVRGPATLLYGSGAAGGLVNVIDSRIHETPPDTLRGGAASISTDSATGKQSGAVRLHAGNDTWVAHFDAFGRSTDNVDIPGYAESDRQRAAEGANPDDAPERQLDNTDSDTAGAAAAVSTFGEWGFVGAAVSVYDTEYGVPGHAHEEHEDDHDDPAHEADEEAVRIDLDQRRLELRAALNLDSFFQRIDFRVADNRYEHIEFEGGAIGTVYENNAVDMRLGLRQKRIGDLAGSVGLQYKSVDFDAIGDEAFVPQSTTDQLSLFAFEELTLSDVVVLQGSARLEHQSIATPVAEDYNDTTFGASLGAIADINDGMSASINVALTERHPNSTELYALGPHIAVQRFERGTVARGEGELEKEVSTNVDLTLRARGDRLQWSLTAFLNRVDDYILLAPTAETIDDFAVFDYTQRDAELYGFEAEATYELLDTSAAHMHTRLFSDYVHGEQRSTGEYLPRLTQLRFGAALHYTRAGLDLGLAATRHAKQNKTASFELPTDGYTLVDFEAAYRFTQPNMMAFLRATNLLDEDARRHTSPLKDIAPQPGRSIALGVRWDF